jgi:hypothetical protein
VGATSGLPTSVGVDGEPHGALVGRQHPREDAQIRNIAADQSTVDGASRSGSRTRQRGEGTGCGSIDLIMALTAGTRRGDCTPVAG